MSVWFIEAFINTTVNPRWTIVSGPKGDKESALRLMRFKEKEYQRLRVSEYRRID